MLLGSVGEGRRSESGLPVVVALADPVEFGGDWRLDVGQWVRLDGFDGIAVGGEAVKDAGERVAGARWRTEIVGNLVRVSDEETLDRVAVECAVELFELAGDAVGGQRVVTRANAEIRVWCRCVGRGCRCGLGHHTGVSEVGSKYSWGYTVCRGVSSDSATGEVRWRFDRDAASGVQPHRVDRAIRT